MEKKSKIKEKKYDKAMDTVIENANCKLLVIDVDFGTVWHFNTLKELINNFHDQKVLLDYINERETYYNSKD